MAKKLDGNTYCLWPRLPSYEVSKLIKNAVSPSSSWKLVKCKVKYTAESYKEMILKRREAEIVSTTECAISSDEDLGKEGAASRTRLLSDSEESLPEPPLKKKNLQHV